MVVGWTETQTDTVWYSPSALSGGLYVSELRHVPPLGAVFKGYVKSRGTGVAWLTVEGVN